MKISPIHAFQIGSKFPVESQVFGEFPLFIIHGFIVFKVTANEGRSFYGFLTLLYLDDEKMLRPHENVIHENVLSKKKESESGAPASKPVCLLYEPSKEIHIHLTLGFDNGQIITRYQDNHSLIEYAVIDDLDWSNKLKELFRSHESLVIADGHHRTAAYFAIKEKSRQDPGLFSAMISIDQVQVRSYHRKIRINEELLSDFHTLLQSQYHYNDFLWEGGDQLISLPEVDENRILMFTPKGWKYLKPKSGRSMNRPGSADLLAHFESEILYPFCKQFQLEVNNVVHYVSEHEICSEDMRIENGDILFLFPPVSRGFLWSSSHHGEILPAKSTWIEPRMPSNVIQIPNTI